MGQVADLPGRSAICPTAGGCHLRSPRRARLRSADSRPIPFAKASDIPPKQRGRSGWSAKGLRNGVFALPYLCK